jgi:hypothetical protein
VKGHACSQSAALITGADFSSTAGLSGSTVEVAGKQL